MSQILKDGSLAKCYILTRSHVFALEEFSNVNF